jgi:hypothetical protein
MAGSPSTLCFCENERMRDAFLSRTFKVPKRSAGVDCAREVHVSLVITVQASTLRQRTSCPEVLASERRVDSLLEKHSLQI